MSLARRNLLFGLPLVAAACLSAAATAAPISSEFALTGDVGTPGTYDLPALMALPVTTQTVGTDTYTGVNLWTLLNAAGGIRPVAGVKNSFLRNYVVAVGSDGYESVFSAGELSPNFGHQPDIVAYDDTGGQLGPGGPDGFARVIAPNDQAHGRFVSNLVTLHVGQAPALPGTGGGISTQFTLSGKVAQPGTYTLSSLESLPATTLTATYLAGGTPVTDKYTGVSLWDLITSAGLVTNPAIKNDVLRQYVVAVGSDGYEAVFSLGEIDPAFGNQQDLVAYADTDGQLGDGGPDGFARLVVPGDTFGGRYVSNLVQLAVYDASVPEPRGIALFAIAALALGLLRARRRPNT